MSTPQDIALKDAVKGLQMFRKVDVPVCCVALSSVVDACTRSYGVRTRFLAWSKICRSSHVRTAIRKRISSARRGCVRLAPSMGSGFWVISRYMVVSAMMRIGGSLPWWRNRRVIGRRSLWALLRAWRRRLGSRTVRTVSYKIITIGRMNLKGRDRIKSRL